MSLRPLGQTGIVPTVMGTSVIGWLLNPGSHQAYTQTEDYDFQINKTVG